MVRLFSLFFLLLLLLTSVDGFSQGSVDEFLSETIQARDFEKSQEKIDQTIAKDFLNDTNPCQKKETPEEKINCFKGLLDSATDDQLQEIGQRLKLQNYQTKKNGNTKKISKFLFDRVKCLIQEEGNVEKCRKDREAAAPKIMEEKLVDQITYHKLYLNQLNKNVLTDLGTFCRSYYSNGEILSSPVVNDEKNVSDQKKWNEINAKVGSSRENHLSSCMAKLKKVDCDSIGTKSNSELGISSLSNSTACIMKSRLRKYRSTINLTQQKIQEIEAKAKVQLNTGYAGKIAKGKKELEVYQGGKDDKYDLDRITTITSGDISSELLSIQEDTKKKLEQCKQDPKTCEQIINYDEKDQLNKALAVEALGIAVHDKIFEKKLDADQLKGYSEYLSKEDQAKLKEASSLSEEELAEIKSNVQKKYKAEKFSVYNNLKDYADTRAFSQEDKENIENGKFKQFEKKALTQSNTILNDTVYSNVAQKNLSMKDENGKTLANPGKSAQYEANTLDQYEADEAAEQLQASIQSSQEDEREPASDSGDIEKLDAGGVIDGLLGEEEKKE